MTNDQFIQQFGHFIDAPNGIQKLRELILQLAVQGRLVAQDPNDEPALALLDKIEDNKNLLVIEKKTKKTKALQKLSSTEIPYKVPSSWMWARLGAIGATSTGKTPSTRNAEFYGKEIPFIGPGQITPNAQILTPNKFLSDLGREETSIADPNDILMVCIGGSIGKSAITKIEVAFNQQINCIKPIMMNYRYTHITMESPCFQQKVIATATGSATPIINRSKWEEIPVPIPPLAEQHHIVAKVDELIALCDQLETERNAQVATHQRLIRAVHHPLNEATDTTTNGIDSLTAWHRIRDNFVNLYTTLESVQALRQTILQLAVQGKLVPQEPADEAVSEVLTRIKKEKEALIREGNAKKGKSSPTIDDSEKPFSIPLGWEWTRLQNLTSLITKGSSPKWQGVEYVDKNKGILFLTSENVGNYELRLSKLKYVETKFNEIEPRSVLSTGDILMNIVGASIGRTAVFNLKDTVANINQAVCLIRLVDSCQDVTLPYLLNFLNSDIGLSFMFGNQVENARANLSMGNIAKFVIPFPPIAEQHRIVAKVDELMALCDQLEANIRNKNDTATRYTEAIVQQIAAA